MLRVILIFTTLAAALPVRAAGEQPVRRAVALLDYVAGDYARAVGAHGELLSAAEHEEQAGFVQDAARELRADTGAKGEDLALRVDALGKLVEARTPPDRVSAEAKALRDEIARRFSVALLPVHAPDVARGAQMFQQACAICHGAQGHPNPAIELDPKPADLGSAEAVKALPPQRAFSAITYGVPATAMPAWDEAYDDQARWDLAFYVLTLSKQAATDDGRALARAALAPSAYKDLAALTDEQLTDRLTAAGLSGKDLSKALAAVRAGPFAEPAQPSNNAGLAQARRGVQQAVQLAHSGDKDGARRELVASYLDHFEPREAGLRSQDAQLVRDIEAAFLALRTAVEHGGDVDQAAARLDALLEKGDARGPGGGLVAFIAALAIALREGVEAALLVAAMLAFLRKAGRAHDANAVHLGWATALAGGAVTWWASGALLVRLSGAQRELAEGVLQLVTAGLLLYASHWLLAALSAKRLVSFLSAKTLAAGSATVIFGLTFVAVFREMFEVVLFFRGLLLDSPFAGAQVALGAATGLVALALLVFAFGKLGKKLKPRPLLVTCGVLLCVLAVLMVGNGVRSLQVLGTLPLTVWGSFEVPVLGVYATREGLLAQALVLGGLALSALLSVRSAGKDGTAKSGSAATATG